MRSARFAPRVATDTIDLAGFAVRLAAFASRVASVVARVASFARRPTTRGARRVSVAPRFAGVPACIASAAGRLGELARHVTSFATRFAKLATRSSSLIAPIADPAPLSAHIAAGRATHVVVVTATAPLATSLVPAPVAMPVRGRSGAACYVLVATGATSGGGSTCHMTTDSPAPRTPPRASTLLLRIYK